MGLYSFGGTSYDTSGDHTAHVRKVWDDTVHERVQNKTFWKHHNFIGEDKGREGDTKQTVTGYPVIRKTELKKSPGDQITVPMRMPLTGGMSFSGGEPTGRSHFNAGVVGNQELVDNEEDLSFYQLKARIDEWRHAAGFYRGMSEQRVGKKGKGINLPYEHEDALTDFSAQVVDDSIFCAMYAGWDFVTMRELGLGVCAPTFHPNQIFGHFKDHSDEYDFSNMTSSDNITVKFLGKLRAWLETQNINPIRTPKGEGYALILDSYAVAKLHQDSDFRDMLEGIDRSMLDPLVKWADSMVENILIYTTNKLWSPVQVVETSEGEGDGITLDSGTKQLTIPAIDTTDDTHWDTSWDITDVKGGIVLGADALAYAIGDEFDLVDRKEDDYGKLWGKGIWGTWGVRRADWDEDVASSPEIVNQSSAIVWYTNLDA
jgi:hypothetical protein